jgi:hypothetical protein
VLEHTGDCVLEQPADSLSMVSFTLVACFILGLRAVRGATGHQLPEAIAQHVQQRLACCIEHLHTEDLSALGMSVIPQLPHSDQGYDRV